MTPTDRAKIDRTIDETAMDIAKASSNIGKDEQHYHIWIRSRLIEMLGQVHAVMREIGRREIGGER